MHRELAESILLFSQGIKRSTRPEDRSIAADYLTLLAPLLADTVLGKDILGDLAGVEQHFGDTWLIDETPFEDAFEKWREFKENYEEFFLASMTVNERLHALSLVTEYDAAIEGNDRGRMREILQKIRIPDDDIEEHFPNPPNE